MAYSMDSEANRENPYTPSEQLTMNEQLMYKLAALDASMTSGFRRLDEKMDRFQSDLHEATLSNTSRINELDKEFTAAIAFKRERIDRLVSEGAVREKEIRDKINAIEKWQDVLMAKIAIAMTAIAMVWIFIAPTIRGVLGIPGG